MSRMFQIPATQSASSSSPARELSRPFRGMRFGSRQVISGGYLAGDQDQPLNHQGGAAM